MSTHSSKHNAPAGNSGRTNKKKGKHRDYAAVTRTLLILCIVFGIGLCVMIGLKVREDATAENNAKTLLAEYKQNEAEGFYSQAGPETSAVLEMTALPDNTPEQSPETDPFAATPKPEPTPASNDVPSDILLEEENAVQERVAASENAEEDAAIAEEGDANRHDAGNDLEVDESADYVPPDEVNVEEEQDLIKQISKAVGEKGVIGTITIPKFNQEYPIIGQWSYKLLRISICRYKGPAVNEKGNLVLIGHNYKSGAHFGNLKHLKVGDEIYLKAPGEDQLPVRYEIYNIVSIEPENFSALNKHKGDCSLTLMTCASTGNQRKLFRCVRKAATSDVDTMAVGKGSPFLA